MISFFGFQLRSIRSLSNLGSILNRPTTNDEQMENESHTKAILLGHVDVVKALLHAMESSPICKLRWPLHCDLAAAALEKPACGELLPADLIHRVVKFEALHLSGASLLHCWATTDVHRRV